MAESSRSNSLLTLLPAVQEPQIVLAALTRLRWLAVIGQVTATAVAAGPMHLKLPLTPIFGIILLTAVSNILLHFANHLSATHSWLVQAVVLLDVFLLTSLLFLTGGPENPFAPLYLVHVTMAVLVLGTTFTWIVVAAVAACYGALMRWHLPLPGPLPKWVSPVGNWMALVLVSVLIGAFIGRVTRALRQRDYELANVRDRAVKNEQLAALTTLAAGAAHELNTPLGTIALVARELELACDRNGDESMQDDARLIRREVDRCRHILSRMRLDLGEDVLFRSPIQLAELGERLRENFDDNQRERLKIQRAVDAQTALAPSRALEQSLLVLLRNAFDASPVNCPVTLDISRREGRLRFEVGDSGAGMSEEMLRRAGEPFFTTKEPGTGMGLGLFLVRLVAEQLGAAFSIDSRLGEGTRCVLELPEREETAVREDHAKPTTPAPSKSQPRSILVVDDDAAFRTRLVKALAARGVEARGAGSATEALSLARQSAPQAAILDLRMPGASGLDLIPQLLSLSPTIQIVILTGYGSIATAVEAVRRGALTYLTKPLDTDQILAAFETDGSATVPATAETTPSLARVEWEHIQRILADCDGNISLAARKLGLHRRSLQRKLGKLPPLE